MYMYMTIEGFIFNSFFKDTEILNSPNTNQITRFVINSRAKNVFYTKYLFDLLPKYVNHSIGYRRIMFYPKFRARGRSVELLSTN